MSEPTAAPAAKKPRPTAPHLTVYHLPISGLMSIAHRIMGVALMFGLLLFTWWCVAVLSGPPAYGYFIEFTKTIIGRFMLLGWTWATVYHMSNGIRHMCWDLGKGFEISEIKYTNFVVMIMSVVLTALIWVLAFSTVTPAAGVMHA